eukprot:COSAG04_NODE_808_length_10146_cov_19.381905_4_plen_298_part_00
MLCCEQGLAKGGAQAETVVQAGEAAYKQGRLPIELTVLCAAAANREYFQLHYTLDLSKPEHEEERWLVLASNALPRGHTAAEAEGRTAALAAMERLAYRKPAGDKRMQPVAKAALKLLLPEAKKVCQSLTMLDQHFAWMGPTPEEHGGPPLLPRRRDHALRRIRLAKQVIAAVRAEDERVSREAKIKLRAMQKERVASGRAARPAAELPPSLQPKPAVSLELIDLVQRAEQSWELGAAERFASGGKAGGPPGPRKSKPEGAAEFFGRARRQEEEDMGLGGAGVGREGAQRQADFFWG